jgi:hypothetical protein
MPSYVGQVQRIKSNASSTFASIYIGDDPDNTELLRISLAAADSFAVLTHKRSLLGMLIKSCAYGFVVSAITRSGSSEITSVQVGPFEIAPNDQPVHEDFYAVTGENFPDDAELVFDSDTATVTVTPDLVRPHLLLVSELPTSIPTGWNMLSVTSSAGTSEAFPVDVSDQDRYLKRVINAGAPKQYPFTLSFVANAAIDRDGTLNIYADPILGNRSGYHAIVDYAMNNIFAVDEDFLRPGERDAEMRILSIFDDSLATEEANTLCEEDTTSTIMRATKSRVNSFLLNYGVVTDLCIIFHGSTTNTRGSASRCADDYSRGLAEPFTYDGTVYNHWPYRDQPGSTAISVNNSTGRMTAIHELGHCTSENDNGRVRDLYNDRTYTNFALNKKWRAASGDAIPATFATYNGTTYNSDPNRDGIGYPSTWVTYHPELQVSTAPNLMDNYSSSSVFDKLTAAWYRDRIRVILDR